MTETPAEGWAAFPAQFEMEAFDDFASLPEHVQRCLDDAIGELEWAPQPPDAADVESAVRSVLRCGHEIVYSMEEGYLVIWGFEKISL